MARKLTIDVDLDDTVADFFGPLLSMYNLLGSFKAQREDFVSWDLAKHAEAPELLYTIFKAPGFFMALKPYPGAIEALRTLSDAGHDINIVTSAVTPGAYSEKAYWCQQYLPFIPLGNVNILHHKGRLGRSGDVLIDDAGHNVENYGAANPKALLIGIEHAHNAPLRHRFTHLVPCYRDPRKAWGQIVEIVQAHAAGT